MLCFELKPEKAAAFDIYIYIQLLLQMVLKLIFSHHCLKDCELELLSEGLSLLN